MILEISLLSSDDDVVVVLLVVVIGGSESIFVTSPSKLESLGDVVEKISVLEQKLLCGD